MSEEVWSQAQRAKMWAKQHALMSRKHNMYKVKTQMNRNINGQRETQKANKMHSTNITDEQARTKQKRAKQTIYTLS